MSLPIAGRCSFGHGAHLLHQRGQLAIGADVAGLGGLELGPGLQRGELGWALATRAESGLAWK